MKKNNFSVFLAYSLLLTFLVSCSSSTDNTGNNTNYTPIKMKFKTGSIAYYELLVIDTADAQGNNGDRIDTAGAQYNIQEMVLDTNRSYGGYSSGVTMNLFASSPRDTDYYYQDASGNLYRYNYGFSILNQQYPSLAIALGSPIDVHWVLVAKPGAPAGTTWTAVSDSATFQSFGNIKVFLKDAATAMTDTTFIISTDTVKAVHVRHLVTASTPAGTIAMNGQIVIDTYVSPELGFTVEDFFHHSKITSPLINSQQKGSLKLMTLK
ncbi:MAG TPA: hypothetical protein VEW28_00815 [Candidatus Kapabacteria bacterium]|nr:hypothetical protein [Candidatus Kapabacteria bacterium]